MTQHTWMKPDGSVRYLSELGEYTLLNRPLPFHIAGLSQTASGYGRKLTSPRIVRLADGRTRRVYVTVYSNAGTAWVEIGGLLYVVE